MQAFARPRGLSQVLSHACNHPRVFTDQCGDMQNLADDLRKRGRKLPGLLALEHLLLLPTGSLSKVDLAA